MTKTVTYVSEHPLPMSPVCTEDAGEENQKQLCSSGGRYAAAAFFFIRASDFAIIFLSTLASMSARRLM